MQVYTNKTKTDFWFLQGEANPFQISDREFYRLAEMPLSGTKGILTDAECNDFYEITLPAKAPENTMILTESAYFARNWFLHQILSGKTLSIRGTAIECYEFISRIKCVAPLPAQLEAMEQKTIGGILFKALCILHSEFFESLPESAQFPYAAVKNYHWTKEGAKKHMNEIRIEAGVPNF